MQYLLLGIGLLLPWWAGFALLSRFEPGAQAARHLRQLGNGFFVGYALLYLLLRLDSTLTGSVTWLQVALALALLALAALLWPRARARSLPVADEAPVFGPLQRILASVLLAWLAAHLWFNLVEVLATPVYPWDAWTVWVYRAKAWFAHAALFEFLTTEQWLQADAPTAYAATALHYPWFVSAVPFWAALSLGAWSETLIGMPVFLLGLALAMAFYGQLRAHGLQPLAALAFSYFLVSTPLLGVHLSLAGYADIWMAGFVGLGFIALLRYLVEGKRRQLAIGLVLLAAGTFVKVEGLIWLVAAVLMLVLCTIPRRWLAYALAAALVLGLAGALFGLTWIELPGLGLVGIRDGVLHLPYLGSHAIVVYDQRWAYWDNAFLKGSWHLAWLFAAALLVLAVVRGRQLASVLVFLLTVAVVQVAIFVFTSQGEWAENYTAINRLPLQVYPAVLFALAIGWHGLAQPGAPRPRLLGVLGVSLASAMVVGGMTLWLGERMLNREQAAPLQLGPEQLSFVAGSGAIDGDGALRVEGFTDGIALLSSGPLRIEAADLYLLRLDFEYDWSVAWPDEAPAFFWRRAEDPENVSRRTLRDGELFDLSDSEDWQGEIIEVGFVVLQNQGQPALLRAAEISGATPETLLSLLPQEWFGFERWTQRSANVLVGGAEDQHIPLNLVVCAWVLLSMVLAGLLAHRGGRDVAASLMLVALLGWMVLDARWTGNRLRQYEISWHLLRTLSVDERISSSETGLYHDWLRELDAEHLGDGQARILLIPDPRLHRYYARRSKYDLLPHSVEVDHHLPSPEQLRHIDYVLYLGDFMPPRAPDRARANPRIRLRFLPVADEFRKWLKPVDIDPLGALLEVRPPPEARG